MSDISLSGVVLFLGDFEGMDDDDVFKYERNRRYEFKPPPDSTPTWLGSRDVHPKGDILCLRFGEERFSPDGWVGGSSNEEAKADIQLAGTNQQGTSRRHFLVDIDPISLDPRITVLGGQMTIILPNKNEPLVLLKDQSMGIKQPVTIKAGLVSLCAWRPLLVPGHEEKAYRMNARQFCQDSIHAVPRFLPSLGSGQDTPVEIRIGRNGREYAPGWAGEKGMSASVMPVLDRKSGAIFAAKEPYYKSNDDTAKRKGLWEAIENEFQLLKKLDHPHIVSAIEVVGSRHREELDEPPWLIMEYIPQTLMTARISEQEATTIASQSLSALAYLHANHIVHGDIKPGNFLQQNNPLVIKLADLADAQRYVGEPLRKIVGSPLYWAPELRESPPSYTNMVDLLSFGLVLIQCLSIWDPKVDPRSEMIHSIESHRLWMREVIVPLVEDGIPDKFRPLLRGLLRRSPNKRWTAAQCLKWLSSQVLEAGRQNNDSEPVDQQLRSRRKRPASSLLSPTDPRGGHSFQGLPASSESVVEPPARDTSPSLSQPIACQLIGAPSSIASTWPADVPCATSLEPEVESLAGPVTDTVQAVVASSSGSNAASFVREPSEPFEVFTPGRYEREFEGEFPIPIEEQHDGLSSLTDLATSFEADW